MTNKLLPGQTLKIGERLMAKSRQGWAVIGKDGNFCIIRYDNGQTLWCSATEGRPVKELVMQREGNAVLYGHPRTPPGFWSVGTAERQKNSYLFMQDDGNLALYAPGDKLIWHSHTSGWTPPAKHKSAWGWVSNAVETAGKAAHSATHAVTLATGKIGDLAGKVPFVGPGLHGVFDIVIAGPFAIADGVVGGARLDKLALHTLKRNLADIKEVAPYAQTVIALVPAVGPGLSGVVGASLALAGGKNITEAMIQGTQDMVPGAALGKAVFKIGAAVMQGKDLDEVITAGLPIPENVKNALVPALRIAKHLANGQKVSNVAMEETYRALPKEAQTVIDRARESGGNPKKIAALLVKEATKSLPVKAQDSLRIGMTLGHAQTLQKLSKAALHSPVVHSNLSSVGKKLIATNSTLEAGKKLTSIDSRHGFNLGIGAMSLKGFTPQSFITLRKSLTPTDRKGFDTAVSLHVGLVSQKAPVHMEPMERAGFYLTNGMRGASEKQKTHIMRAVAAKPEAREGAKIAIVAISETRMTLWDKVKRFVGV